VIGLVETTSVTLDMAVSNRIQITKVDAGRIRVPQTGELLMKNGVLAWI
jgi:hypothetical protein